MINITDGKCPSCGEVVRDVTIDDITASVGIGQPEGAAVSYSCKSCKVVLGVGLDPLTERRYIVQDILQVLGRK